MSRIRKPKGSLWLPYYKPAVSFARGWYNCCPVSESNCFGCTIAGGAPEEMIIDLGAGGWIDDDCDYCDQITGQYTLDKFSTCWWIYEESNVCIPTIWFHWPKQFFLQAVIVSGLVLDWRWEVRVLLHHYFVGGHPSDSIAIYHSAESSDSDCLILGGSGVDDKLQLDKTSESHDPLYFACSGIMEDPIFLWIP